MVTCRAACKNFQQKWLTKSKPSGNYLGMRSHSFACPCAIVSTFQSRSSLSTIVHENGCVLSSFKWNINKGALKVGPLCKHWDDAVCKTKGGLERQFTANNRKTAPKQKAHFHAIQIQILKQRKKKKNKRKNNWCFPLVTTYYVS